MQPILPILIDAALKGLVILLLAALVTAAMRRSSAAARHLVWTTAVVAVLTMPLLAYLLPGLAVLPAPLAGALAEPVTPLQPERQAAPPSTELASPGPASESSRRPSGGDRSLAVADAPSPAAAPHDPGDQMIAAEQPNTTGDQAVAEEATAASSANADASPAVPWWRPWLAWLPWVWLGGAAFALIPLALGWLSLWHLKRTTQPIAGGSWQSLLNQLRADIGLKRPVALLMSPCRTMPMTWGALPGWLPGAWGKATVLIPEDASEWSAERRRAVLLHELAHIQRRDCLTQMLTQIACALYWFNPLVWFAAQRMLIERERACDDLVLLHETRASDYAQHLLDIATGPQASFFAAHAGIAMARRSKLDGRLVAILDQQRNRRAMTRLGVAITITLLGAVVVPVAMLSASGSAKDDVDATMLRAMADEITSKLAAGDVQSTQRVIVDGDVAAALRPFAGNLTLESIYARFDEKRFALLNFRTTLQEDGGLVKVRVGIDGSGDKWVLRSVSSGRASDIDRTLRRILEREPAQRLLWGAPLSPYVAELPGHVTVELVGLARHPSGQETWWDPSGKLLATPPASMDEKWYRAANERILERVVRVRGVQHEELSITSDRGGASELSREDGTYLWHQAFGTEPDRQAMDMRLGIAFGPWATVAEAGARSRNASSGEHGNFAFGGGAHRPEGGSVVTVTHDVTDRDYRIVAITEDGGVVAGRQGTSGAGGFLQTTVEFSELPLERITRFHFQTRPYHWVEFRNVSLQPEHETQVEVVVESGEPDGPAGGEQGDDGSTSAPASEFDSQRASFGSGLPHLYNAGNGGDFTRELDGQELQTFRQFQALREQIQAAFREPPELGQPAISASQYREWRSELEQLQQQAAGNAVSPEIARWLILLDWLAGEQDAQEAAKALRWLGMISSHLQSGQISQAYAMIVLARDGLLPEARAQFRTLLPAHTPQFGWFVFELNKYFSRYVESKVPPQSSTQQARTPAQRQALEQPLREAQQAYADYLEYDLLPAVVTWLDAPQQHTPLEVTQMVDAMRQLPVHHARPWPIGIGTTNSAIERRFMQRIAPDILAVWQKSVGLLDEQEAKQAHSREIAEVMQRWSLTQKDLDQAWQTLTERSPRSAVIRFFEAMRDRDLAYLNAHTDMTGFAGSATDWSEALPDLHEEFDLQRWRIGDQLALGDWATVNIDIGLPRDGWTDGMFVILHRRDDRQWIVREFDDWGRDLSLEQRLERFRQRTAERVETHLGPVIERKLSDVMQTRQVLDLDTSRLIGVPDSGRMWGPVVERMNESGADLFYGKGGKEEADLWAAGTVMATWPGKAFEDVTAADVIAHAQRYPARYGEDARSRAPMKVSEQPPGRVYFVRTREGAMGVLQVTSFTNDPEGVEIRYKLVQADDARHERAAQLNPASILGTWRIRETPQQPANTVTFHADGTFQLTHVNDGEVRHGVYQLDENQLTMEAAEDGAHTFEVEIRGDVLIFRRDGQLTGMADRLTRAGGENVQNPPIDNPQQDPRMNEMRQVLVGLMAYLNEHDGQYPDELDAVAPYVNGLDLGVYRYAKPADRMAEVREVTRTPILFEAEAVRGDGWLVGFADGHVEFVRGRDQYDELRQRAAQVDARQSQMETKGRSLRAVLQTLRSQIQIYYRQHDEEYPTYWWQLTRKTNEAGTTDSDDGELWFGPYLQSVARNPFHASQPAPEAPINGHGWSYEAQSGELRAVLDPAEARQAGLIEGDSIPADHPDYVAEPDDEVRLQGRVEPLPVERDDEGHPTFRWRVTKPADARPIDGWFTIVDGVGPREHGGGAGTSGTAELVLGFKFEQDDLFRFHRIQRRTPADGGTLTATMSNSTASVDDAEFRWRHLDQPAILSTDSYQTLWRGEWVRDGEVVKTIVYAARLPGADADDTGGFGQNDPAADRVRPLPEREAAFDRFWPHGEFAGVALGDSREVVLERWGEPRDTSTSHGQRIRTDYYPPDRRLLYHDDQLVSIRIGGVGRFETRFDNGFDGSMTREQVIAALGPPVESESSRNYLFYRRGDRSLVVAFDTYDGQEDIPRLHVSRRSSIGNLNPDSPHGARMRLPEGELSYERFSRDGAVGPPLGATAEIERPIRLGDPMADVVAHVGEPGDVRSMHGGRDWIHYYDNGLLEYRNGRLTSITLRLYGDNGVSFDNGLTGETTMEQAKAILGPDATAVRSSGPRGSVGFVGEQHIVSAHFMREGQFFPENEEESRTAPLTKLSVQRRAGVESPRRDGGNAQDAAQGEAAFDRLTVTMDGGIWGVGYTLAIEGDGRYRYVQQAGRNQQAHEGEYRLKTKHIQELTRLLAATDWLKLDRQQRQPAPPDAPTFTLSTVHNGDRQTIEVHEHREQAYKDLLRFLQRIERQERLLAKAQAGPAGRAEAARDLEGELRAVHGDPASAMPYAPVLDYRRLEPVFGELLREYLGEDLEPQAGAAPRPETPEAGPDEKVTVSIQQPLSFYPSEMVVLPVAVHNRTPDAVQVATAPDHVELQVNGTWYRWEPGPVYGERTRHHFLPVQLAPGHAEVVHVRIIPGSASGFGEWVHLPLRSTRAYGTGTSLAPASLTPLLQQAGHCKPTDIATHPARLPTRSTSRTYELG